MIFFCEDCGGKNLLAPTQLKDGKAVFRCDSCDYLNSYSFSTPEEKEVLDLNVIHTNLLLWEDI